MKNKKQTKVISILNQKGGAGKTTATINLGMAFHKAGKSVLLVDSDPQGSLRDWNSACEEEILPVIGLDRDTIASDLEAIKGNHDIIIIDGEPRSRKLASLIKCADIIIIPVIPSPFDVWASSDLINIIKARHEVTDGLPPSFFIINRAKKHTKLSKELPETLQNYEFKVLEGEITDREIYPQSAAQGKTVYHDKTAKEAIKEITLITNQILEKLENA